MVMMVMMVVLMEGEEEKDDGDDDDDDDDDDDRQRISHNDNAQAHSAPSVGDTHQVICDHQIRKHGCHKVLSQRFVPFVFHGIHSKLQKGTVQNVLRPESIFEPPTHTKNIYQKTLRITASCCGGEIFF